MGNVSKRQQPDQITENSPTHQWLFNIVRNAESEGRLQLV